MRTKMEWSPGPGIKVGEKSRSAARRHVRKRPQASQCGLNVPHDAERLILATGRYIGEGFDDARLDTLFLTMPIAWKRTLAQYIGRLHRQHDDKKDVVVVDYVATPFRFWPAWLRSDAQVIGRWAI